MISTEDLTKAKNLYMDVLTQKLENLRTLESFKVSRLEIDLRDRSKAKRLIEKNIPNEIGVYAIFTNPQKINDIRGALTDFRNEQKKIKGPRQRVPRPNDDAKALHGCLYIGMSRDSGGLNKRILQHLLGTSALATSSLKCNLWLEKSSSYELIINYIKFNKSQIDQVRDCEKTLWNYYEPAIGAL